MLNLESKRLAYSVWRIAYRKLSAIRCPCLAGRQALNAKRYLMVSLLLLGIACNVYAFNLDKVKGYFLEQDYKTAIREGEKILANTGFRRDLDELYYIMGLSYMKEENYLRASDIFEIILKEFKDSRFKEDAIMGLGDTCLLREDFAKAQEYYVQLIKANPDTKLKAQVYYRLSHIGFKKGDTAQGREYSDKLKQEFPLNLEPGIDGGIKGQDFYYTVQVGAFSSIQNARNLTQKLVKKDYPAYIEEGDSRERVSYRVRVGKFSLRKEAEDLENKLAQEGYPTKIYP